MINKKIILYIIVGLLIVGLIALTLFPNMIYVIKDSQSSNEDKCTPPEGTTLEAWREHMSHHPNIYAECLT